jgi:hypothetical protein
MNATLELSENEIIQLTPAHEWGACVAIVSEVKSWGCIAFVRIPHRGEAYVRLSNDEFFRTGGSAVYMPISKAVVEP